MISKAITYRKWTKDEISLFFSKVELSDGNSCWIWKQKTPWYLHGSFKGVQAHRVMWHILNGKIPKGKVLDHLCENKHCVNIHHLEPVTQVENFYRSYYGVELTGARKEMMDLNISYRNGLERIKKKYGKKAFEDAKLGRRS